MKTTLIKIVAGSTLGALLVPTLAFADNGVRVRGDLSVSIGTRIEKALDRIEHKGDREQKREDRDGMSHRSGSS